MLKIDEKEFLKKTFDDELPDDYTKNQLHWCTILIEMEDTYLAIEIIKIIKREWNERVENSTICYDKFRNVTYESYFYRVIFGITKIFDFREKNGILKFISKQRHNSKNKELLKILDKIEDSIALEQNKIDEIKLIRDKLLGHLDKEMKFSSERISLGLLYYYIEFFDICSIYSHCIELYNYLFNAKYQLKEIPDKDYVINKFF